MRMWTTMTLAVLAVTLAAPFGSAQVKPEIIPDFTPFSAGPKLLFNRGVQEELKLTKEQKTEIDKIADKHFEAIRKAAEDNKGNEEKKAKALDAISDETDRALSKTIDNLPANQAKRFKQINRQVKGVLIFAERELAVDQLELTKEQLLTISELLKRLAVRSLTDLVNDGDDPVKREAHNKKLGEMHKATLEKIIGVLTDEQKKTWAELVGAKFDFKPERDPREDPPAPPKGTDKGPGKAADKTTDKDSLQGTWVFLAVEIDGKEIKDKGFLRYFEGATLTFKGDSLTDTLKKDSPRATYSLDPDKKPPALDVAYDKGKSLMLYELKGDTLRLCGGPLDAERPKEFVSKDKVVITTYKRGEKKPDK